MNAYAFNVEKVNTKTGDAIKSEIVSTSIFLSTCNRSKRRYRAIIENNPISIGKTISVKVLPRNQMLPDKK